MFTKFARAALAAAAVVGFVGMATPTFAATNTEARVRIIHASPDAPKIDVYVNDKRAFHNVAFKQITPYEMLKGGEYEFQIVPAGKTLKQGPVIISTTSKLEDGKDYSMVAVGPLAKIEPLVLTDNSAAPQKGEAGVRFVNASPDAPASDVVAMSSKGKSTNISSNTAFKDASNYVMVPAGSYKFDIKPTGTDKPLLNTRNLPLKSGDAYTLFTFGLDKGKPALSTRLSWDNRR